MTCEVCVSLSNGEAGIEYIEEETSPFCCLFIKLFIQVTPAWVELGELALERKG